MPYWVPGVVLRPTAFRAALESLLRVALGPLGPLENSKGPLLLRVGRQLEFGPAGLMSICIVD